MAGGQKRPLATPLTPEIRRIFPRGRLEFLENCWRKGQCAEEVGWDRVSPYYEDPQADGFWFSGFDGMSFEAAFQLHSYCYSAAPEVISTEEA